MTRPPRPPSRTDDPHRHCRTLLTKGPFSSGPRGSQMDVQLGHHRGAFADGGADTLDRTGAHVTDGENAGSTGLQRQRPGVEPPAPAPWIGALAPVSTKPFASSETQPSSQLVAGAAPMKRNKWRIGLSVSFPEGPWRQRIRSSWPSGDPESATTSVFVSTSMFPAAAIRSTRYCDMVSARLCPRTSSQIFAAWDRRNTAA